MNFPLTIEELQQTKEQVFFIAGTSRSGSTLLQSMLNMHSRMVIPPETHFFHAYEWFYKAYKSTENKAIFARQMVEWWYNKKTRIRDLGLDEQEIRRHSSQMELYHPLSLFTLHLTLYRLHRKKPRIGEKTPRHILHVPKILKAYPGAKIITLFRDPRAAANSEKKAAFGSPSVQVTTRRWRQYVQMHEHLAQELPASKYLMLRYCDLIEDVKGSLQKVCDFLGEEFEPDMLEYYKRDETGFASGETSWKKGTLKPIQPHKNQEWEEELAPWEQALVDDLAGSYLKKMGYEHSGHSLPLLQKLFYQSVDFSKSAWATLIRARDEGYMNPNSFKLQRN